MKKFFIFITVALSLNSCAKEYETIKYLQNGKERTIRVEKVEKVETPTQEVSKSIKEESALHVVGLVATPVQNMEISTQDKSINYTKILIEFKNEPDIDRVESEYKIKYIRTLVNGYMLFENRSGKSDGELIAYIISHEDDVKTVRPDRMPPLKKF
ncbi:MAG: hypothetical protein U9N42_08200 [Campylobacterota bacterium]|nr:hypothetical protein [Campylobacterota bacterium]